MGQYYIIANLDKREYLLPNKFGDGAKLWEFSTSSGGTMSALAVLLASSNGRGGGDLQAESPIIGSWAGDRIVITGDYDDEGRFGAPPDTNLWDWALDNWRDISLNILAVMRQDPDWL